MALYEQDGAFSVNFEGQELMHSKASASETLLGLISVERLEGKSDTRTLVGGLGLGYTLRSILESTSEQATVEVAELIPDVVQWNKTHLKKLNGSLLEDPRVKIRIEDVARIIQDAVPETYDAMALDVDNGPVAMVSDNNFSLYSKSGIQSIYTALKPQGRVVFWSAGPDKKFEERLGKTDLKVTLVPAKVSEGARRAAYLLYVADKV